MADDFSWVVDIRTVDAIDRSVVNAMVDNPGWLLLHAGVGEAGQTTLTFAWPAPSITDERSDA